MQEAQPTSADDISSVDPRALFRRIIDDSAHTLQAATGAIDPDCWPLLHANLEDGTSSALIMLQKAWSASEHAAGLRTALLRSIQNVVSSLIQCKRFDFALSVAQIVGIDAPPLILDYARRLDGEQKVRAWKYHNVVKSITCLGTVDEIDQALRMNPITPATHEGNDGVVEQTMNEIQAKQRAYEATANLPNRRNNLGTRVAPTAAIQLTDRRYDATIGILWSGASLANHMHCWGSENVGYIEWHRHWQRDPVWRLHDMRFDVRKHMNILLCENDAVSGRTLTKVLQKIDTLNPANVDVCFTGIYYEKSREKALQLGAFRSVFHIADLDQSKVYSDMLRYREKLLEKVSI